MRYLKAIRTLRVIALLGHSPLPPLLMNSTGGHRSPLFDLSACRAPWGRIQSSHCDCAKIYHQYTKNLRTVTVHTAQWELCILWSIVTNVITIVINIVIFSKGNYGSHRDRAKIHHQHHHYRYCHHRHQNRHHHHLRVPRGQTQLSPWPCDLPSFRTALIIFTWLGFCSEGRDKDHHHHHHHRHDHDHFHIFYSGERDENPESVWGVWTIPTRGREHCAPGNSAGGEPYTGHILE